MARDDETIILVHWFDERTKISIQLPFYRRNEFESKKFMSKVNNYTKGTFNFHILWQARKIETLFKLKDKNIHPSHVIYIGTCTCDEAYIGETANHSISLYTPWELAFCNHKYKTVGLCNFITLKMIARSKTFSQTFYQFLPFTIL